MYHLIILYFLYLCFMSVIFGSWMALVHSTPTGGPSRSETVCVFVCLSL